MPADYRLELQRRTHLLRATQGRHWSALQAGHA